MALDEEMVDYRSSKRHKASVVRSIGPCQKHTDVTGDCKGYFLGGGTDHAVHVPLGGVHFRQLGSIILLLLLLFASFAAHSSMRSCKEHKW